MSESSFEAALRAALSLLELLSRRIRVREAYLFGSYAKGTWLKTSDVDLVIVSEDFRGMRFLERLDLINELQWKAGIRPFVEAIPLTPDEFAERLQESAVLRDASKYWIKIA
ncbi:MAG: nucleotidyltransferase domain-containing protein [Thermofilaceae archaeon]